MAQRSKFMCRSKAQINFGNRKSKPALGQSREVIGKINFHNRINNIEAWRSLVARLLWEQDAAGSSPVASTIQNKSEPLPYW